MALNIKPLLPREPIIYIPTPKEPDTMDANTKTDPGPEGSTTLRTRSHQKDEKEKAKKKLWVWGIY